MKLAVLTDSHSGVRSDSTVFLDNAKKFYDKKFFPTIQEYGIKKVLHLGDILDRRKFINFVTANRLRKDFIEPLAELGLSMDHVLGNHDVYYKDRNDVSGVIELYGNSNYPIDIITETVERTYGDTQVLLVPWICDENQERSMATIKASKARVCMGHLELNGFEMNKGSVMDHGMDSSIFNKFEVVASGHYHHGSKKGGIHYLGATGEFDWSDWDDPRGFHIFDTETLEFTPIRNPYHVFRRIDYDDTGLEVDEVLGTIDPEVLQDCYVKVMVNAKTNPYLYDRFIDELEKAGVADLQIVEEYSAMQLMSSQEILSQAEDTVEIMNKYVDSLQTTLDSKLLTRILHETYREAVMVT